MAGMSVTAYLALNPSTNGFAAVVVEQLGPQLDAASEQLGQRGGATLGESLGGAVAKSFAPYKLIDLAMKGIGQGIDAMLEAMVGFNSELQDSELAFSTMLRSAGAAEAELAWVKDFAKTTPFQFGDVAKYDQQLIRLGLSAEQAHQALQAAGNAAVAVGAGSDGIGRISLALGQMWASGQVQAQQMQQLADAGIGGLQILADHYQISVAELQGRVTDGLVSANDAIPALIAGLETRFGGLMDTQSDTFGGMWSNIIETLQQSLAEAGEPLFQQLTADAREFMDALNDPAVQQNLNVFGQGLAEAARVLGDVVEWAWKGRDAFLALGAAMAVQGLYKFGSSEQVREFATQVVGLGPAFTRLRITAKDAALAQSQFAAATDVSNRADTAAAVAHSARATAVKRLKNAQETLRVAQSNQVAWGDKIIESDARVVAASGKVAAAKKELAAATEAANRATVEQATATRRVEATDAASVAAMQSKQKATSDWKQKFEGVRGMISGLGIAAGTALMADGFNRAGDAANDAGAAIGGAVEAMGGGAVAGAAFGLSFGLHTAAIGAVSGAVVGLVGSLWQMSAAMEAANADTSLAQASLTSLGVESNLASLALKGIENDELEAAGGFGKLQKALQTGTFGEYMAELKKAADSQRELASTNTYWMRGASNEMRQNVENAKNLVDAYDQLAAHSDLFLQAQEQTTLSQYQAAFASDLQTGSLGTATQEAWNAAVAQGNLSAGFLQAALQGERLAGVAGFATEMVMGIPKGTKIDFDTNAKEIADKIAVLIAARDVAASTEAGQNKAAALDKRIRTYQSQISNTATVSPLPPMSIGGGGGGRSAAANAAKQAADEAARKLKQDQQAQVRFADAFGSLMEAALGGNFDQYRDRLEEQIKSLARDGYQAAADTLKRLSGTLTQSSLDYAALTNKLKKASDAYDDLTKRMRDQYDTSRELVLGMAKVTDAASFDQLAYLLGETTSAATQYQEVLKQLKDQGLSEQLWNQLAAAGPESMGLAQSILDQGQAGIDQLNTLTGTLVDAADSMGDLVSQSMYQQGVDAMNAYIEGLRSQSSALEAQLTTIANNILTQTAGAITPGNAGYSPISSEAKTTANTYQVSLNVNASSLGDIRSIQDFIQKLESAPTSQLVNQAGTVTS